MGRRVNLSNVDDKPVAVPAPVEASAGVPLDLVVANPRNPRDTVGDLNDLQSIATRQLQPCLAVSAKGYLALWPEDAEQIGDAKYVVVNGCRRLAAAQKFGRSDILLVHDESVAASRGDLLGAAVDENVSRRDFDVIEEAKAVDAVVSEYASSREAAAARGWTHGWISQRRALLKLSPEMQEALRSGDLAVRDARRLARVPAAEQVAAWEAEREARKEAQALRKQSPPASAPPASASDPVVTAVTTESVSPRVDQERAKVVTAVTTDTEHRESVPEPRAASLPASEFGSFPFTDGEEAGQVLLSRMSREERARLVKHLLNNAKAEPSRTG
ncbi:hypothetical protein ABT160_24255 [Streptomyces sp. NPDC001941]|uniref:ParB/RepB/Spo0J family partition protein n=1 Tax=Streptomyces sp. NPDC001941 TaxID=3154659 RepID=UPI003323B7AD